MAVLTIPQLLEKFGPGDAPRSSDYIDLIDTLADDRNAVYFDIIEPVDTAANPLWFNTSTNELSVYSGGQWNTVQGSGGSSTNISATSPLSYNSETGELSIDLSTYDTSSEVDTKLTNYDTSTVVNSKISTAISNLIDSAPSSLDTLNELAAALDDDANFATTVTNQIATKVSFSGSETLLNKRINPRTETSISPGILTINSDTIDFYTITNLAQNLSFAAPSGTPVEGQRLTIRIKDNGTARTISWNSIFRGSADLSLPTITVASTTMYLGFIYNSEDLKWDMIARLGNF